MGKALIQKAVSYAIVTSVNATLNNAEQKMEEKLDRMISSSDPKMISAGLFSEFMTGLGPEHRDFGENNPMTQDLAKSRLTAQARAEFYKKNKEALAKGDFKNIKKVSRSFTFGVTGLFTEGTNAQQFVGSAKYTITLSKDKKSLQFTIYNETSEESFKYHNKLSFLGGAFKAKSHTRDEDPVMGTISQTFTFTEPLQIEKKKK